jgi:hypothetical protein
LDAIAALVPETEDETAATAAAVEGVFTKDAFLRCCLMNRLHWPNASRRSHIKQRPPEYRKKRAYLLMAKDPRHILQIRSFLYQETMLHIKRDFVSDKDISPSI